MGDLRDVYRAICDLRDEMAAKRHLDIIKELFALGEITKDQYVKYLRMYYQKG